MSPPPLKVLFTLHPALDTLDIAGPFELLTQASHTPFDTSGERTSRVFSTTITAVSEQTTTGQNLSLKRHISIEEAHSTLSDYDVLVIPGGGSPGVLEGKTEPIHLIKAFASLPKKPDGGVRFILTVCTGALFAAEAGVLDGLSATTHPLYYDKLREITGRFGATDVKEERYVVNKVDEEKGLRIVTAGGVSCGLDASLWLIGEVAGAASLERTAELVMYAYRKGVVI